MKKKLHIMIVLLTISVIFIATGSGALELIPYADFEGNSNQVFLAYLVGAAFWFFTVFGQVLFWIVNCMRKRLLKTYPREFRYKAKIGLLCFCDSLLGLISDFLVIICIVLYIFDTVFSIENQMLSFTIVSVLVFSLQMHCIFNGENFKYINYYNNRRRKNEQN